MDLNWTLLENGAIDQAWDEVAASSPGATFFQTRAWANLLCTTFPHWRPDPVVIEFSDGNLMVLPMLRRLHVGHRASMLPNVYGGPLFRRPPDERHLEAIEKVPRWYPNITLLDNPFSPYGWEADGLVKWRCWTQVTDLSPGFATLWKNFRKGHRNGFKVAQRNGITVTIATRQPEVDAYYEVYRDSLRRWGKEATGFYPRELFRRLLQMPEYGKNVRLWLAHRDGKVIGGLVMLYQSLHAVTWHGSTHSAYMSLQAETLLSLTAMKAACQEGFHWFDFMANNSSMAGVARFKEGFASERRKYNSYYLRSPLGRAFDQYSALKERYLRRCPL